MNWDDQGKGMLHVAVSHSGSAGMKYERLGLSWQSCVSELGTAVVVDGRHLKITPLRITVVPPPMSAVQVTAVK